MHRPSSLGPEWTGKSCSRIYHGGQSYDLAVYNAAAQRSPSMKWTSSQSGERLQETGRSDRHALRRLLPSAKLPFLNELSLCSCRSGDEDGSTAGGCSASANVRRGCSPGLMAIRRTACRPGNECTASAANKPARATDDLPDLRNPVPPAAVSRRALQKGR